MNKVIQFKKRPSKHYFNQSNLMENESLNEIINIGTRLMMLVSEISEEIYDLQEENEMLKERLRKEIKITHKSRS